MKMLTKRGVISVVEDRDNNSMVLVRALEPAPLTRLAKAIPYLEVKETPRNHYPFRAYVKKADFGNAIVGCINYTSFITKEVVMGLAQKGGTSAILQ